MPGPVNVTARLSWSYVKVVVPALVLISLVRPAISGLILTSFQRDKW